MRILKSFLCLLIFVSIVPAQQEKIVPIMTTYYLLGGSKGGKWLTAEAVAPKMEKKTKMVTVSLQGIGKGSLVLENTGEEFGACPENVVFKFEPEIEPGSGAGIAVGENAGWNLVPRVPKSIAVTDKTYQKIAADFLRTKGIARSPVKLDQILRVDLEGDGQDEIVITGNYYRKPLIESQGAGDYSFALIRKIIRGKPQNILIEGEFFTKKGEYDPPNERAIAVVADLNGDGRMEIVLDTSYYEGTWEQVFEVGDNGKLTKVLEVSCLV